MNTKAVFSLEVPKTLSIICMLAGAILLVYMIMVEEEPGVVPLILLAAGTGGLIIANNQINKQPKQ